MIKGRQVLSLPILTLDEGNQLGEVKGLIYNSEGTKLKGVIMEDGGWLWGAKLIRFEDITAIGHDALTIADESKVCSTKASEEARELWKNCWDVSGFKIITQSGRDVGTVEDILMDPESGKIKGFEISDGVINDLLTGRIQLMLDQTPIVGDGAIIVPDDFENIWQQANLTKNV